MSSSTICSVLSSPSSLPVICFILSIPSAKRDDNICGSSIMTCSLSHVGLTHCTLFVCLLLPWLNPPFFIFYWDIACSKRAQLRNLLLWKIFCNISQDSVRSCSHGIWRSAIVLVSVLRWKIFLLAFHNHNQNSSRDTILFSVNSLVIKHTKINMYGMNGWMISFLIITVFFLTLVG